MREKFANHRQRLAWIGQLPPHQHHQGKTEEKEDQSGESVLDADYLVVGGENIFSPPPELVMFMFGGVRVWIVMSRCCGKRSGSVHSGKVIVSISRETRDLQSVKFGEISC